MRLRRCSFVRPVGLALVLLAGLLTGLATAAPAGAAGLPVPAGLPRAIEPLADYVEQVSCRPQFLPGTAALGRLLVHTYPGTSFGGDYACGTDGTRSEHYDGRAVDWMNSVRDRRQAAQASAVLQFLLGTDRYGNTFANARRMGVMYVIWNNRIWGAWDGRWAPYNNCAATPSAAYDSSCHRNHMHLSLSWNGAMGRTSYWSRQVTAATDFGPCRSRDLNWAEHWNGVNRTRCASYPKVAAPAHSSAVMVDLVRWSGAGSGVGSSGPAVLAVQHALGVAATGSFGPATTAAVTAFKRRHRLPADARMDAATWRALLAAFRPH